MPTGYTAPIEEGDLSAKAFALRCAREFGAFIHQREEGLHSKPQPPEVEGPASYKQEWLANDVEKLSRLMAMTHDKIRKEYEKYLKDTENSNNSSIKKYEEEKSKYDTVREKIEAWQPNEESMKLKEFCLNQIMISMPYGPYIIDPIKSVEAWHRDRVEQTKRSIKITQDMIQKEHDRQVESRRYAIAMLASIEDIKD